MDEAEQVVQAERQEAALEAEVARLERGPSASITPASRRSERSSSAATH